MLRAPQGSVPVIDGFQVVERAYSYDAGMRWRSSREAERTIAIASRPCDVGVADVDLDLVQRAEGFESPAK